MSGPSTGGRYLAGNQDVLNSLYPEFKNIFLIVNPLWVPASEPSKVTSALYPATFDRL